MWDYLKRITINSLYRSKAVPTQFWKSVKQTYVFRFFDERTSVNGHEGHFVAPWSSNATIEIPYNLYFILYFATGDLGVYTAVQCGYSPRGG